MSRQAAAVQQIFALAVKLHTEGKLPQAEAHYNRVLAVDPRHVGALTNLGILATKFRQHDLAVELMQKAVDIEPESAQCHRNLGVAKFKLTDFRGAIASLDRALALDPDQEEAVRFRDEAIEQLKTAEDPDYAPRPESPWRVEDVIWEEFHGNETLLMVFSGLGINNGIPTFMFYNFLRKNRNVDKLFLRDRARSWFMLGLPGLTDSVEATTELLRQKVDGYQRVVCIGCSAGGSAAILFGELLGVDKVIAFSPQTVLSDEKEKVLGDDRWAVFLAHMREQMVDTRYLDFRAMNPFSTDIDIHYGLGHALDTVHAQSVKGGRVSWCGHNSSSHIISLELRDSGELRTIIDAGIQGGS